MGPNERVNQSMGKVISKRYNPQTRKLEEVHLTRAQLAHLRAQVSKRFSKDGKDRVFQRMLKLCKPLSKRKSLQPA